MATKKSLSTLGAKHARHFFDILLNINRSSPKLRFTQTEEDIFRLVMCEGRELSEIQEMTGIVPQKINEHLIYAMRKAGMRIRRIYLNGEENDKLRSELADLRKKFEKADGDNVEFRKILRISAEAEVPQGVDYTTIEWLYEIKEISIRTKNCLSASMIKDVEIKTLNDLENVTENDLLRVRNLGKKCVDELKAALAKRDKKLKDNPELTEA